MENTVTIDIARYNELRDLETETLKGNSLAIYSQWSERRYYTEDQIISDLAGELSSALRNKGELTSDINEMRNTLEMKERYLSKANADLMSFHSMSIWKFMKWKRNQSY